MHHTDLDGLKFAFTKHSVLSPEAVQALPLKGPDDPLLSELLLLTHYGHPTITEDWSG